MASRTVSYNVPVIGASSSYVPRYHYMKRFTGIPRSDGMCNMRTSRRGTRSFGGRRSNKPTSGSRRLTRNELSGGVVCQPEPDNERTIAEKNENLLKPQSFDLNITTNRASHHTAEFDGINNLIVRRGQPFDVTVTYNRPYNRDDDRVIIKLTTGETPKPGKGTSISLRPGKDDAIHEWRVDDGVSAGDRVTYKITPGVHCPVANWSLSVTTVYQKSDDEDKRCVLMHDADIYVLFNPWNKDDQVYMADAVELDEYVMNERGRVYVGSASKKLGRPWNYGQFDGVSLQAAMRVLDKAELIEQARGNATLVVRTLSAMVNSNDDDGGILIGNWSGNYSGGTAPTAWSGSAAILEEYVKGRQVKWAQCWVFAAIATTLCRSLGIPSRSVTNFDSAHDTDASMTIDTHISTETNEPIHGMDDSIWNFHVWNEAWFRRTDLPDGYDGWQAFDSTPQELSEGIMRCGPAPLKAIKEGDVFIGYDTKFLFGEVNGDQVTWGVNKCGKYQCVSIDKNSIGRKISTKKPGDITRLDITDLYKHKEGSEEERNAMTKAMKFSNRRDQLPKLEGKKELDFSVNADDCVNGDMVVLLSMENGVDDTRIVDVAICANACFYTGLAGEQIYKQQERIEVPGHKIVQHRVELKADSYLNTIDSDAFVKFFITARVVETGQMFCKAIKVDVDKPDFFLNPKTDVVKKNRPFELELKFTNPLRIPLTNLECSLEGRGITSKLRVALSALSLAPGQTVTQTIKLTPKITGKREIIVNLNTRQIVQICGTCEVEVRDAPADENLNDDAASLGEEYD